MAPIVLGYAGTCEDSFNPFDYSSLQWGADFAEEFHTMGMGPEFSKDEWFALKPNLPLDFPNLPFYYDGDVKITQSIAIQRYLARKYGLDGKTEQEKVRIDLVEQQLVDYRDQSLMNYSPDFDTVVISYKEELPGKLSALSKFLGSNYFFSGGGLSHVDFMVYEWLDIQNLLVPNILTEYPNLRGFHKRIEEIPEVEKFMQSDRFIKFPLSNKHAKWAVEPIQSRFLANELKLRCSLLLFQVKIGGYATVFSLSPPVSMRDDIPCSCRELLSCKPELTSSHRSLVPVACHLPTSPFREYVIPTIE